MDSLYIFIDESGTDEKSDFFVVSVVLTEDPGSIRDIIHSLIDNIKRDPEIGNMPKVKNVISNFHYVDDDFEVRNKFIDVIPKLNFDAYVSFVRKGVGTALSKEDKIKFIQDLITVLVYPRIQEKYYKDIFITYEEFDEGSSSTKDVIKEKIMSFKNRVEKTTGKIPNKIEVSFLNKDELCLSLPDYMCGIVQDYIKLKNREEVLKRNSKNERNYDRVSGKIRILNDYNKKIFYNRKNPFEIGNL